MCHVKIIGFIKLTEPPRPEPAGVLLINKRCKFRSYVQIQASITDYKTKYGSESSQRHCTACQSKIYFIIINIVLNYLFNNQLNACTSKHSFTEQKWCVLLLSIVIYVCLAQAVIQSRSHSKNKLRQEDK